MGDPQDLLDALRAARRAMYELRTEMDRLITLAPHPSPRLDELTAAIVDARAAVDAVRQQIIDWRTDHPLGKA